MNSDINDNKDTFRMDMIFPLYFPILYNFANVSAAEFMQ